MQGHDDLMKMLNVDSCDSLKGICRTPADKSISHRSLMLGAIANSPMLISNILRSADVLSTLQCLKSIGFNIQEVDDLIRIYPTSRKSLKNNVYLDCGNSGTTMRLLCGLIAPMGLHAVLDGDASLRNRPMARVAEPLNKMGASLQVQPNGCAPILISPSNHFEFTSVHLPVASAQLKSACLLAGVQTDGCTVTGGGNSRDHTERFLSSMGANLEMVPNGDVTVHKSILSGIDIEIPGDVSSAAFIIAAALICPESMVDIMKVNINPTRTGIVDVVTLMGGRISIENLDTEFEPTANLRVQTSDLNGIEIPCGWIPRLIDELPIIAILATQAEGTTQVTGAKELRYKESDRIKATVELIRSIGGAAEELDDGFVIEGPQILSGGVVNPYGDHRIAMAACVAGLRSKNGVKIQNPDCIDVSFPSFSALFSKLGAVMYNG